MLYIFLLYRFFLKCQVYFTYKSLILRLLWHTRLWGLRKQAEKAGQLPSIAGTDRQKYLFYLFKIVPFLINQFHDSIAAFNISKAQLYFLSAIGKEPYAFS